MERLRARLYEGMAERGITGGIADQIYDKLAAFANFGFPESHSVSFAYLVYSSSWIKLHYPAAFCAALLNAQPMGFYSPQSLVADARRHGVTVFGPDINASAAMSTLEPLEEDGTEFAVRMGIRDVRHIGADLADVIDEGRPYASMEEVVRHANLTEPQVEAIATAGAFGCFKLQRREALWAAGAVAQAKGDRLPGIVVGSDAPTLPDLNSVEETVADLWSTGVSPNSYPTEHIRDQLDALGAVSSAGLRDLEHGTRVLVGGVVTHRQRPATAGGTTFVNLEDETGLINIVCSKGAWAHYRRVARTSPALLIRGKLEKVEGVINVIADKITPLSLAARTKSRDFR
jgi:error-prone DNA polymerase